MISRKILTYLFTLGLALTASVAQAIPLLDLFEGADITVGDKLFNNWNLEYAEGEDDSEIDFDEIDVTGLNADPLNIGLNYAGNGQLAVFGPDSFLDLSFSFDVTVLSPDYRINGASLEITETDFGGEGGLIDSLETVSDSDNVEIGVMEAFSDNLEGDESLLDSLAFGSQASVSVITDILLFTDEFEDDSTELVSFEQHFSQTKNDVAEPSTLFLMGMGLAAICVVRRRPQGLRGCIPTDRAQAG